MFLLYFQSFSMIYSTSSCIINQYLVQNSMGQKGLIRVDNKNQQEDLVFYLSADDPMLGRIKIYTSKKVPLCFIVKYECMASDTKIYNLFQKIEQNQLSCLIRLYGFRIDRDTCCQKISGEKVISYWEYYNFYFIDYLEKRVVHTCMFLESQIWHLVEVVCEGYSLFRKYGIYYQVNPSTLLITPEGKLKVVWNHLKSQNSHLKYLSYFQTKKFEKFFYSPEELQGIYQGECTVKLNFDKCNSFRLGMIILYCLCMADPIYLCYNPSMTKINFNIIKNMIVNKIVPSYSSNIIVLLTNLLKENPKERPTLAEVLENYGKYMTPENQLRVCGGRMPGQRGPQTQSSLNNRQTELNHQGRTPKSEHSDTKTVKMTPSIHKI